MNQNFVDSRTQEERASEPKSTLTVAYLATDEATLIERKRIENIIVRIMDRDHKKDCDGRRALKDLLKAIE